MRQRSFLPIPESVAAARAFVLDATGGVASDAAYDLSLMVSELCTNAILHGSGPFVVTVERGERDVRISVTDHGGGRALVQRAGALHPRGRGLRIVEALSNEWGTARSPNDETVVWFRQRVSPHPARPEHS